ncbi:hypothetical protein GALL_375290 [mine drainage metagenome]|uniref:Multi-ubiquitin domain-containing protein n=1 Tax=mine drainage metagenome TaxID=410659 RepID=A0A1J5QTA4_9ZZZZ
MSEHGEHDEHSKKPYHFFLDAKRYETEHQYRTGTQIKEQASAPLDYQLFLEEEGDTPDRAISDSETVDLAGKIKHFYAVPPATFGSK